MQQIDIAEATAQLSSLLARAIGGEEIVITKDDRPVVKLLPVPIVKRPRQPGSAKGMITLSGDFDEPIADFEDYL
jgi:prevent-host-death family protein